MHVAAWISASPRVRPAEALTARAGNVEPRALGGVSGELVLLHRVALVAVRVRDDSVVALASGSQTRFWKRRRRAHLAHVRLVFEQTADPVTLALLAEERHHQLALGCA